MAVRMVKISAIAEGLSALGRLAGCRLSSYAQTRKIAKYYGAVIGEVNAYNAEIERLEAEFPDRAGDEYESRLALLVGGEVELDVPTLCEEDFYSPGDVPTPADMFALRGLVDFE